MKNREIKFRVWDKTNKEWLNGNGSYGLEGMGNFDLNDIFTNDMYIFQQYTGLKDKNGKEIYEGDLMTGRETPILVEYKAPEFIFVYKNKDGGFCSHYICGWADFSGEIIGNIFENPELLKS